MRLALVIGQAIATLLFIGSLADLAVLRDPPRRRPLALAPVALAASLVLGIAVAVTG